MNGEAATNGMRGEDEAVPIGACVDSVFGGRAAMLLVLSGGDKGGGRATGRIGQPCHRKHTAAGVCRLQGGVRFHEQSPSALSGLPRRAR